VQWVLDRHQTFGERFLCYLVGGIDELQVTLAAVKPSVIDPTLLETTVRPSMTPTAWPAPMRARQRDTGAVGERQRDS
jgi:hypothetical protein